MGKTKLSSPLCSLQPEHAIQYLKLNTWQSQTHDQTLSKTKHRTLIFPTSNSPLNLSTGRANSKISPRTDTPQICFKRPNEQNLSQAGNTIPKLLFRLNTKPKHCIGSNRRSKLILRSNTRPKSVPGWTNDQKSNM